MAESTPSTPPSSDTLLLPTLFVNDRRGKLIEKDTLTAKGKLELAEKTMLTPLYRATFGPLGQLASYYFNFLSIFGGWHPNEADALTLYQQEERLKMLGDMDSLIRTDTLHDNGNSKQLRRIRFGAVIETR